MPHKLQRSVGSDQDLIGPCARERTTGTKSHHPLQTCRKDTKPTSTIRAYSIERLRQLELAPRQHVQNWLVHFAQSSVGLGTDLITIEIQSSTTSRIARIVQKLTVKCIGNLFDLFCRQGNISELQICCRQTKSVCSAQSTFRRSKAPLRSGPTE